MANDTQNSPEGQLSRDHVFGMEIIVNRNMPADQAVIVSHTWDNAKGRMIELDRATIRNLA